MSPRGRATDHLLTQDIRKTIKAKQLALSLTCQDDCKTRKDTKYSITKQVPNSESPQTMGATIEPRHEISNNVVCATSKASDQHAHTRSLIRAFACRLNIL